MSHGENALVDFQTAYLRALAHIWLGDEIGRELVDAPDAMDALGKHFDFDGDWHVECKFNRDASDSATKQPSWNSERGDWVAGTDEDEMTIFLPDPPADAAQRTAALAAYYRLKPTVLGINPQGKTARPAYPATLGSWFKLQELGRIVNGCIALAWNNATFKDTLFGQNPERALRRWFAYSNPLNVRLNFVRVPVVGEDEAFLEQGLSAKWWAAGRRNLRKSTEGVGEWTYAKDAKEERPAGGALPPAKILLQVPNKPASGTDGAEQIALAALAQAGYAVG